MTERALGQIMAAPDTAAVPLIEEPAKQRAHPARTARERARTVRQLVVTLARNGSNGRALWSAPAIYVAPVCFPG